MPGFWAETRMAEQSQALGMRSRPAAMAMLYLSLSQLESGKDQSANV